MKEFIFNENDIIDLEKVAEELFINTDIHDPSSIYYERHLERPRINWFSILLHISIVVFTFIMFLCFFMQKEIGLAPSILISFSIIILYIIFSLKRILICLVRIYQRFAPSSLRMKCRFEPSCSQYMILALEKYGAFKGLKLGIKRLTRCKVGNGGYDYP